VIGLLSGCAGEERAQIVDPSYAEPCRYFATDCSGVGECHPDERGVPACLCAVGYEGFQCEHCEEGFHRDARDRCISDRRCSEQESDPCAPHGTCGDSDGVIECSCTIGYGGPRCTLCSYGYARDRESEMCTVDTRGPRPVSEADAQASEDGKDSGKNLPPNAPIPFNACPDGFNKGSCKKCATTEFEDGSEFPSVVDTCSGAKELLLPQLIMRSRVGSSAAYVWKCAKTTANGMSTRHVELEAGASQTAQMIFPQPVTSLRFQIASRSGPLGVDVLVNDQAVKTLESTQSAPATVTLDFAAPTMNVALRSRSLYTQYVAIDDVTVGYQPTLCE
jgi:hypothetical protein